MNKKLFYSIIVFFLMSTTHPARAQLARRMPEKDSTNYQGLIRKNLELRKEVGSLEEKYMALEEERKVLILHVRDLQATRNATNTMIQDLKSKIASLRVEMFKDPKMVKTIDGLNQRVREALNAKDGLQRRVDILGREKEKLFNELNVLRDLYNREKTAGDKRKEQQAGTDEEAVKENGRLAEELEQARLAFKKKEEGLMAELRQVKEMKAALKKKNQGLQDDLKEKASWTQSDGSRQTDEVREAFAVREKELNGKIKDILKTNEDLKMALREAKAALMKEQEASKRKTGGEVRREEEERLKQAREAFTRKEGLLIQKAGRIEGEKDRLEEKLKEIERAAMVTEKELLVQMEKMKKENVVLKNGLAGEETRLEAGLDDAKKEKEALSGELAEAQKRLDEIDGENQLLRRERKDINASLKKMTKQIETQAREAKYDKEYLERKAKNVKADKMMFEAKLEDLEQRAVEAEAELRAVKKEMETGKARTSLQESEIMVLREEKSKLEQKLIRYIEKIIQNKGAGRRRTGDGAGSTVEDRTPLKAKKARTKKETARQKLKMHYNLALAYDRQGMYREEEKEYLKCLKINPKDANVHYNLAILYDDKLNRNKKAIAHYKKFLELRPVGEDVEEVKGWMLHAEQEDRLGPQMR